MARDPDEGDAVVFELVDDDAAAAASAGSGDPPGPGDAEGDDAGASEPSRSDGPGRKRRTAAQVAAVLAIVLGTGIAVDGARDQARIERMRDVRGGVADVSTPLAETWAWGGAVGPGESATDVAALGDVLAFESDDGLVALDPATGEEAWTVPLRADADCGPIVPTTWPDPATDSLVCLQGGGRDRAVVVVGPDGAVAAPRVLDTADARRYGTPHTGPDGTLLRARRVGPVSEINLGDAECTGAGECTGTVVAGRDLVLRAEDAVTGEERWTVTVPFRTTDATQCTRTFSGSWGSSETGLVLSGQLAPDTFGARVTADLIALTGCGIQAAVTPDGVVLGADLEPGTAAVLGLGSGRYAVINYDGVARATLHTADGDAAGAVIGYLLGPQTTDEVGPATMLTADEPGRRLRAYDLDGTERWDIALQSGGQEFLAQVGDTAVITTGAGSIRALDAGTGEERWAWDGSDPAPEDGGAYFGTALVRQAFTDGLSLLLVIEGGAGRTRGLAALDLASGAVLWNQAGGGAITTFDPTDDDLVDQGVVGGLVALDGYLLEVTPRGVRGLG